MIHLKHQILFSLKNNEKIFMNVVCCSRDWHFKVNYSLYPDSLRNLSLVVLRKKQNTQNCPMFTLLSQLYKGN